MSELGLYVHFPWCIRKCPYCDFNSHPTRGSLDESGYVDALLADAEEAFEGLSARSISSVFLGGGTPSLFAPEAFEHLLGRWRTWFASDVEITLEANPGTTEFHDPAGYLRAGINRLSLGAQSFDDQQLRRLGRIHSAAETRHAFQRARAAGFRRINLDVMYALPRQTIAAADRDLAEALDLGPDHVSWYQLTIEPKTEFAGRPPKLPGERAMQAMEAAGVQRLRAAGFDRYEVSAFARDQQRCRHNLNYWSFGDYLGIGAGAHGKRSRRSGGSLEVLRTTKPAQPRRYLADPTATEQRIVDQKQLPIEFLLNALRLPDGLPRSTFTERTGLPFEVLEPHWSEGVASGLLDRARIAATPLGFRHLDGILARFLD